MGSKIVMGGLAEGKDFRSLDSLSIFASCDSVFTQNCRHLGRYGIEIVSFKTLTEELILVQETVRQDHHQHHHRQHAIYVGFTHHLTHHDQ